MNDALRRRIVAGAAVAILLGGCAGNPGTDDSDQATTELNAEASEFQFDPSEWTAPADVDVDMTLSNVGETDHEWVIINAGEELASEDEFEEELVAFEVEAVPPGEDGSGTFNLPAGTYQIICALPGHFGGGMEGSLTLE